MPTPPSPASIESSGTATPANTELSKAIELWVKNDYLCKNFILNDLSDNLYDYYHSDKSAKEI